MFVVCFQTEHVARQIKCADLTPAVAEDFGGAYAAALDSIEVLGRLAFAVDLFVTAEYNMVRPSCAKSPAGRRQQLDLEIYF